MPRLRALACSIMFMGLVAGSAGGALAGPRTKAVEKVEKFQGELARGLHVPARGKQLGKSSRTIKASLGELPVYLRIPFRGVAHGIRLHTAALILAHELGHPDMVPKVAAGTAPTSYEVARSDKVKVIDAGKPLMVVNSAPEGFQPFDALGTSSALAAVSQEMRVTGALMHVLTRQLDGNAGSTLIRPADGALVLIDHDVTFGTPHTTKHMGSIFFPNDPKGNLAFDPNKVQSFADLPAPAQALVTKLASMPIADVASRYGLNAKESAVLVEMATLVKDRGLVGAIGALRAQHAGSYVEKSAQKKMVW